MRSLALFLVVALSTGCATLPSPRDSEYGRLMIRAPFDATWDQLVDLVDERGWPIADVAKAAGLIDTEWMQVESSSAYHDCGAPGTNTDTNYLGRFKFVVHESVGRVPGMYVTLNTSWRAYPGSDASKFVECNTTGVLERHLLREMQTRLEVAGVMPRRRWSW
jgi:uncharacterized lipoprotein